MTDCCGVFGRLFGHKFEKHLIRSKLLPAPWLDITYKTDNHIEIKDYLERCVDKYEILCKRCGRKL